MSHCDDVPVEEKAFFDHMRTCRANYRKLGECIAYTFGKPHDAIDIGCGVGDSTERLAECGWNIMAAEFSDYARSLMGNLFPSRWVDLTHDMGLDAIQKSVAICTETAEHLAEEHAMMIVRNVSSAASKWIVWSAAQPGQEWPGHVNLQPSSYWLELFELLGWVVDREKTDKLRKLMVDRQAQHWNAVTNFFILGHK